MDDNQHLNRLLENKTLGELFSGDGIRSYARVQQTHVPPPDPLPLAVDHLPPPRVDSVSFTIRGRADFGPFAYHGPSKDRVKDDILNAILSQPDEGYKDWLPAVVYELTDVWDYTGGNDEQEDHEHRGAARENTATEGSLTADDFRSLILSINTIALKQEQANQRFHALERAIADERAARALEAAVRQHGGPAGTDPAVHDRDGKAVPTGPESGDRGTQRRGRNKLGGKSGPTAATGDGGKPVDVDSVVLAGPADSGEVRSDDAAGSTPVVAPGYIPVNPHTGEEL